jgi:enoyl-CoA hydratase
MKLTTLNTELHNSILTLTINRPEKLNALSVRVLCELKTLLQNLKEKNDEKVRAMILTGAGEKAFIAGADILEMSTMSVSEGEAFCRLGQEVSELFEAMPFPVIACVNGYAFGGGCEMAMSCDYIFATEHASFAQPEINLGLIPCFGGCVRLPRYVGIGRAKELIFTGRRVNAAEAKSMGLINEIFATKSEMLTSAKESLAMIISKSALALNVCKSILNSAHDSSSLELFSLEQLGFRDVFGSTEKEKGVLAFLDKKVSTP